MVDSAIVVPGRCIQEDVDGNSYVFVLDTDKEGRAITRKVPVQRVMDYKGGTMLKRDPQGGLKGTETILDEGAKSVADGQQVKVIEL
jgi:hypothetical protein